MFFSFQNPASEHAQAIIDFHHYVFFFLLIIIIFVVWLLKMVLYFIVYDNNIKDTKNLYFLPFYYKIKLFYVLYLTVIKYYNLIKCNYLELYELFNYYIEEYTIYIFYYDIKEDFLFKIDYNFLFKIFSFFSFPYKIRLKDFFLLFFFPFQWVNYFRFSFFYLYYIFFYNYYFYMKYEYYKGFFIFRNSYYFLEINHGFPMKLYNFMFFSFETRYDDLCSWIYKKVDKYFLKKIRYYYYFVIYIFKNILFFFIILNFLKVYNLIFKKILFLLLDIKFILINFISNNKNKIKITLDFDFKKKNFERYDYFSIFLERYFIFSNKLITVDNLNNKIIYNLFEKNDKFLNKIYWKNKEDILKYLNYLNIFFFLNNKNNYFYYLKKKFLIENNHFNKKKFNKITNNKLFNEELNFKSINVNLFKNVKIIFFRNIFNKINFIKNISKNSSTYLFPRNLNVSFFYSKFILIDLYLNPFLFFSNVKHKQKLEWIWTCIPALILLFLLYPSLLLLYGYDRPHVTKPYLTFKAIGNQWFWSYEYSDNSVLIDYFHNESNKNNDNGGILKKNGLQNSINFDSYLVHEDDLDLGQLRLLEVDRRVILPVGVCIRLITTSSDVLHSWAIPSLAVKIDAVPGRLNQFWLVLNKPGVFYGQCSEICGVNHGFMPIAVEGVHLDQYYDYLYNYLK